MSGKAAAACLFNGRAARMVSAAGPEMIPNARYFEDRPPADGFTNEPFPNGVGYVVRKKGRTIADKVIPSFSCLPHPQCPARFLRYKPALSSAKKPVCQFHRGDACFFSLPLRDES